MVIADDHIYLTSAGSLHIVEIEDSTNLSHVASISTPGDARAVAIQDSLVYVADGWLHALQIVHVGSPSSPYLLGSVPAHAVAEHVAVSGDHAYLAMGYDLMVVDLSDVSSPEVVGYADVYSNRVVIEGSRALVAERRVAGSGRIHVIDIADPPNPEVIGGLFTLATPIAIAASDTHAFVTAEDGGLLVADISNPSSVPILDAFSDPSGRDVVVSGSLAFHLDWQGDFRVYDVSNPSNVVFVGGVDLPGTGDDMDVVANRAFVALDDSGLHIVSTETPSAPTVLAALDAGLYVADVAAVGDVAYLAAGGAGLVVVDITDVTSPIIDTGVPNDGWAWGIDVRDGYAYLATTGGSGGGLQIVDLTDPGAPELAGAIVTPSGSTEVLVRGDHAYLGSHGGGPRTRRCGGSAVADDRRYPLCGSDP